MAERQSSFWCKDTYRLLVQIGSFPNRGSVQGLDPNVLRALPGAIVPVYGAEWNGMSPEDIFRCVLRQGAVVLREDLAESFFSSAS